MRLVKFLEGFPVSKCQQEIHGSAAYSQSCSSIWKQLTLYPFPSQAEVPPLGRHTHGTHLSSSSLPPLAPTEGRGVLHKVVTELLLPRFPPALGCLVSIKVRASSSICFGVRRKASNSSHHLLSFCNARTSCEELESQSFTLPQFPHLKTLYLSQTYCNKIM